MGSIEKHRSSRERGSVIAFSLIILGLFLTLTAFALDVGSLYLWRLRVDNAARAAALGGLGYRTTVGFATAQQNLDSLRSQAEKAAMYNLSVYGANTLPPTLVADVDYNPGGNGKNETIKVDLTYRASTLLVGRLSGIFGFSLSGGDTSVNVTSSQSASLNPAYLAIVIDVSGSMFCPAVEANPSDTCACRRANNCDFVGSKLEKMVDGLRVFTDYFNPNTDYISIIPFNLGAWTAFSMIDTSGEPTPFGNRSAALQQVLTDVDTYAGSNTNHCDALAQTINEFNQLAVSSKMNSRVPSMIRPYVLFFTDGAPNAFRGIFSRQQLSDTALQPNASAFDEHDYSKLPVRERPLSGKVDLYHYAIEWYDADSPSKAEALRTYRGPSPFVVRDANSDGTPNVWKLAIGGNSIVPLKDPTDATSRYPHCGSETSDPTQFIKTIKSSSAALQDGCLNSSSFSFDIPYTGVELNSTRPLPATVRGVDYETTNVAQDPTWPTTSPAKIQLYDQLPYYCAIEAADYIRSTFGGTIFTIGLGPGALATDNSTEQPSAGCADPLQDANDHVSRKDSFLTRLAYAEPVAGDSVAAWHLFRQPSAPVTTSNCLSHRYNSLNLTPLVGYTSSTFLPDDAGTGLDPSLKPTRQGDAYGRVIKTEGGYYPTPDANQLPAIFGAVAKSILLRLAS
jgi:hypothetical protein